MKIAYACQIYVCPIGIVRNAFQTEKKIPLEALLEGILPGVKVGSRLQIVIGVENTEEDVSDEEPGTS